MKFSEIRAEWLEDRKMVSPAITTLIKIMETLPEEEQNQVVEALRAYIADLHDENLWDRAFSRTQPGLIAAAKQAKHSIRENRSQPLDESKL
jgi:hypothetical protein